MNTEEEPQSFRETPTAEIQNNIIESKLDRDTNSKDSDISPMGDHQAEHFAGNDLNLNDHLDFEKGYSYNGSETQSATATESNTPENTVKIDTIDTYSNAHTTQRHHHHFIGTETGELVSDNGLSEREIIKTAILLNPNSSSESAIQALYDLSSVIKHGNCKLPIKQFKPIMKMIMLLLQSPLNKVIIATLRLLGRIICTDKMKSNWVKLLELILLKIIDSYKMSRDVSWEIDYIIQNIAVVLPLDASINILNPVIEFGEYPTNLCAIKLLMELVDHQGAQMTDQHLDSVMPKLAKQTENVQSMVRKAAVFCIVRLYVVLGEEKVRPKFSMLNYSQIALLNIYIFKKLKNIPG